MITGFITLDVSDWIRCNHGNSGISYDWAKI